MTSLIKQNFHVESEAGINKQINLELYASYVYQSMAFYFDRDDLAFTGFYKFFKHNSDEEREHAEKFMRYQTKRGGRVLLKDIQRPQKDEWGTPLQALQAALDLEKNVNQSLLSLHALAATHNDSNFSDFLETEFLKEQVDAINELGHMITKIQRVGTGLGEYTFDKNLKN